MKSVLSLAHPCVSVASWQVLIQNCVQEMPKIPEPSSSQRPIRESKGRRGQGKGRFNIEKKDKLKDASADTS